MGDGRGGRRLRRCAVRRYERNMVAVLRCVAGSGSNRSPILGCCRPARDGRLRVVCSVSGASGSSIPSQCRGPRRRRDTTPQRRARLDVRSARRSVRACAAAKRVWNDDGVDHAVTHIDAVERRASLDVADAYDDGHAHANADADVSLNTIPHGIENDDAVDHTHRGCQCVGSW